MRAADLDDDLAWELAVPATTRRPSMIASRLASAFRNGVLAGLVPSAIVLGAYFFQHHEADLPWVKIASILAVYGPGVGVLLAVFCEALMIATDRIARVGFGIVAIANPITACALGGLLSGIAPGAVGVLVFGSYRGPFVGTSLIAFGLIAGAVMVAVPLAMRARRLRQASRNPWIIGAATLTATVILSGVAAIIAPVIVGAAFDAAREGVTVDEYGGLIGAVGGAVGGGVSGVFIGIVVIFARGRLSASASPTATAPRRT